MKKKECVALQGHTETNHSQYVSRHIELDKSSRDFKQQNPKGEKIERHHRVPDFQLVICDGSRSGRIVRRNQ